MCIKKLFFIPFILILVTGCQTKIEFCKKTKSAIDAGFIPHNKTIMKRLGIAGDKNISDYDASQKVESYCSYLIKTGNKGGWVF